MFRRPFSVVFRARRFVPFGRVVRGTTVGLNRPQLYRFRHQSAMHTDENGRYVFRAALGEQQTRRCEVLFGCAVGHCGDLADQFLLIATADLVYSRWRPPLCVDVRSGKKMFRTAAALGRHKDDTEPLLAGSTRGPASVDERFRILRKIGVDD